MADTAYAAVSNVQALINTSWFTIGGATEPDTDQVQAWLNQFARAVDSVLTIRGFGTVPATGTGDILLITPYLAGRVAYEVWHVVAAGEEVPPRVQAWLDQWNQFLLQLDVTSDGTLVLLDQKTPAVAKVGRTKVYGKEESSDYS